MMHKHVFLILIFTWVFGMGIVQADPKVPANIDHEPLDGLLRKYVDDIEHQMFRPVIGWKVHAVVVCAARSCPPLLDRAYSADDWEEKVEERYRTWLAREDLNSYDTRRWRDTVEISRIFRWYSEDYTGGHAVEAILRRYGPAEYQGFFEGGFRITYKDYHWGLNDSSDLGKEYSHSLLRSLF